MLAPALALAVFALGQPPAPAPAAAAEKPKVLVLDLDAADVGKAEAKLIDELVTQSMARFDKYAVVSSADVRQLASFAANQTEAGCDSSSCLAEIAGAMGARYVVFGNIGKLGDLTIITLSLFDTASASANARQRIESRDPEQLP
ncbi:MAG TPA: hypothetical protein VGO62_06330, partial [Myxococcota bacterium]